MKKISLPSFGVALLSLLLPLSVEAHQIGGYGFASGATHPLSGIDHLLAMVAVGTIAVRIGGKASWTLPATFVTSMVGGGWLAVSGVALPVVETIVALSVLFFGVALFLGKDVTLRTMTAAVVFFALFHGYAHGQEIPSFAHPALYVFGFVLSTAALHATGIVAGKYATKSRLSTSLFRLAGASMSLAGVIFLIG